MSKTAILRARVDCEKASAAEQIFSKLGITVGDAINIFLSQVCIQKAIPFALSTRPHLNLDNSSLAEIEARYADRTPNTETRAALNERPIRKFKSATETLRALKT